MRTVDLTKGPVLNTLITLAIPIVGSSVLQLTYNLVDMLLVGRLGFDAVASIGSSSFLTGLGYAINACVVVGTGIKVAHSIGADEDSLKSRYLNAGFRLNGVIAILFAIFVIFFGPMFLQFLDLGPAVFEMSYYYLLISAPMLVFAFINMWYTRVYNSFGSNKSALKISAVGVFINIVLDVVFIYGLNLHVFGAGLATLVANLVMNVLFYVQSKALFKLTRHEKCERQDYQDIVQLGLPIAIQRVLFTLVNIGLAKLIAVYGAEAIAAQKISLQIESVTFMIIGGLNGAMTAFVGQNYGAKRGLRIQEGVSAALKIGASYAVMTTIFLFIAGAFLTSLFVTDEQTIAISAQYLKIVGLSQIFMALEIILNGVFNGLGLPKIPATISIVFTTLRLPLALCLMPTLGINGIWLSIALSSVLKGLVASLIYYLKVKRGEILVTKA